MKPKQRDLFPGALEVMIHHTLRASGRLHGYALVQEIKHRSELEIEEGSLYPALQRMLRAGLLQAEWTTSATNRRIRQYRLTVAGRRYLEREVSSIERMFRAVTRVLASAED